MNLEWKISLCLEQLLRQTEKLKKKRNYSYNLIRFVGCEAMILCEVAETQHISCSRKLFS